MKKAVVKKNKISYYSSVSAVFMLVVLTAACVTVPPPKPLFLDPEYSAEKIDVLTFLPIADIRIDKSVKFKEDRLKPGKGFAYADSNAHKFIQYRFLEPRNFHVVPVDNFGSVGTITEDDVAEADPSWIKKLGPENARWVLLLMINDFVARPTFGAAASTECSGVLFDKELGKAIWRHEASGELSMGGLQGLLVDAPLAAISFCAKNLINNLPSTIKQNQTPEKNDSDD